MVSVYCGYRMTAIRKNFQLVAVLILCSHFCFGQGQVVRPEFSPVFQVEVQGIFRDAKKEMEGTLFYDSVNNRGAFYITYQGVTTQSIYRFVDNELLQINGTNCAVSGIKSDTANRFFPFFVDLNGKTRMAKPEELFFFTNSMFVKEEFNFPSYVYKAKLISPFYDGSNCEVSHVFTKPEMKVPECDGDICQSTLAAISIKCLNNDGSVKSETSYDFYRFKSGIIDTNVFSPPAGIFCNVTSQKKFPGLPDYFSFSYDLTDDQKGTSRNSGVFTAHKKVWYDSKLNILRTDEFDAEGVPIESRVFDVNGRVAYTSRASLSTCEMGIINNEIVPLDEITKLPKIFFLGDKVLNTAVWVGTRRIRGLNYEVWSLSSDKQSSTKTVQNFYFTKSENKPGISEIMKLSHAEIFTYSNNEKNKYEQPELYLPVNNFMGRPRWEAFDVSSCFKNEQKRRFRLKVNGPPTVKDSKLFQEILNQLHLNLIRGTNISAIRLSELACVFDGVKIVEFTGLLLDKPKVINFDGRKNELDLNEAYRWIDYLASSGKLSLRLSKDGQIVDYKITAIEDIKQDEGEDKNLYSGGVVAGFVFGGMTLGMILGSISCWQCDRKLKRPKEDVPAQTTDQES